jgi:hypothetical protein
MKLTRRWYAYFYWKKWKFFHRGFRYNGGGLIYSASPYHYWRIGPIEVRKYV